ncbi:MAG: OmpA family protein [Proteobacteria bacterium]|nr:OmpA family protein [Pseudomonadota bacterium]
MKRPASGIGAALVAAVVFVAALVGASCGSKPKAPGCKGDADCKDGLTCSENACVECKSDLQCPKGKKCSANACIAAAECTRDDQCAEGKVCQAGKCKACAADGECGPGGTCKLGACERGKKCGKDADCADDEDCVNGICTRAAAGSNVSDACALQTVYFGFDDSSIQASERERLDTNATCMEKSKPKPIYLIGHTDTSGTEEYNIALSERRAQSVSDYLSRSGVDASRLQVVPKGETEPTGLGDDKDRRCEFQWH